MSRPTKRNVIVDTIDGQDVTLEQQLLSDIRLGIPVDRACARSGIVVETYYDWLRKGNAIRLTPPKDPEGRHPRKLSRSEKEVARFSEAAMRAEADGMALLALHVYNAATQPQTITKTVVRTRQGADGLPQVVERTTTTETVQPDWRAAIELLQRRWPKEFGRINRHEHSGEDGEPIPVSLRIDHILSAAAETAALYESTEAATGTTGKILELNPIRETGDD